MRQESLEWKLGILKDLKRWKYLVIRENPFSNVVREDQSPLEGRRRHNGYKRRFESSTAKEAESEGGHREPTFGVEQRQEAEELDLHPLRP